MEPKDRTPHINVDYFEDLTGDIEKDAQESVSEIADRLKALRESKGISIEKLSEMTGFEADLLSSIEDKKVYPQLGTVIKLSKALDAAFGNIISGAGDKPYSITRAKDRKTISRSTSQKGEKHIYSYKGLASEVKGRNMEPLIVQLSETMDKDLSMHAGEEFIYVLNGIVVLELGDESFELEPGDSAYYLSATPHWLAAKNGGATILAVIYG